MDAHFRAESDAPEPPLAAHRENEGAHEDAFCLAAAPSFTAKHTHCVAPVSSL